MRLIKSLVNVWSRNSTKGCRIVALDVVAQTVSFHVKNKAVVIRCKFSEAINNLEIIDQLSPHEACWLGGHFGRALRASLDGRAPLKKAKQMSFLLRKQEGRNRIVFENRTGEIGYIDTKTHQEYVEHPVAIATNDYVIALFNPNQACYIGILAGIRMEKALNIDDGLCHGNVINLVGTKPKLKIVS